jgi:hypothetical protein
MLRLCARLQMSRLCLSASEIKRRLHSCDVPRDWCGSDAVVGGAAAPPSVDGLLGPGSGASSAGAGEGVSISIAPAGGSKDSRVAHWQGWRSWLKRKMHR